MKKTLIAITLIIAFSLSLLTGCAQAEASAPMTLADGGTLVLRVNPEIAVDYDKDGIVTAVSARNDDALAIIASCTGLIGQPARTAVTDLVTAIGDAGYFVEEIDGERRQIVLEIEPGSSLPTGTFLEDVVTDIRNYVSNHDWSTPLMVDGLTDYGMPDYVDTDYGPGNDGITDYNLTDYGKVPQPMTPPVPAPTPDPTNTPAPTDPSVPATPSVPTITPGNTDYGITDYNDTDYGPNNDGVTDYGNTDYGPNNDGVTDYGNTDYGPNNDGVTDYGNTDYGPNNDGVTDYDMTDYGVAAPKPTTPAQPAQPAQPADKNPGKGNTDYGKTDYNDPATDYGNTDYDPPRSNDKGSSPNKTPSRNDSGSRGDSGYSNYGDSPYDD